MEEVKNTEIINENMIENTENTEKNDKDNKKSPKGHMGQNSQKEQRNILGIITKSMIAVIVLVCLFFFGFTYQVREGDCALILRFGAVRKEITEAGLYFKLPYPFETVVTYDNKLQPFNTNRLQITTRDQKSLILESYVLWNIDDPEFYNKRVSKDRNDPDSLINAKVFSVTNSVLGNYYFDEIVSLEGLLGEDDLNGNNVLQENSKLDMLQEDIFKKVYDECKKDYGIEIKELGIRTITLPDSNLISVLDQMVADRQREINTIISKARVEEGKINNAAKEEAAKKKAEGTEKAAEIKAQAEQAVAKIYADAASKDIELYKFMTNLDVLVKSIGSTSELYIKTDKYPFNILTEYSKQMKTEGNKTVIEDLQYILENVSEEDRKALEEGLTELIDEYVEKTLNKEASEG